MLISTKWTERNLLSCCLSLKSQTGWFNEWDIIIKFNETICSHCCMFRFKFNFNGCLESIKQHLHTLLEYRTQALITRKHSGESLRPTLNVWPLISLISSFKRLVPTYHTPWLVLQTTVWILLPLYAKYSPWIMHSICMKVKTVSCYHSANELRLNLRQRTQCSNVS